jgi:glycosyltransferase involved in cell wall biosynthesis
MKMCEGFAFNNIQTKLIGISGDKSSDKQIFDFYNVKSKFSLSLLKIVTSRFVSVFYYPKVVIELAKLLFFKDPVVYGRSVFGCCLSLVFGFRTVIELHAPLWEYSKKEYILFNFFLNSSKLLHVVVISDSLKNIYSLKNNISKFIVLHDASVVEELTTPIIKIKKNAVGYVGSLNKGKGIELIIEIASILKELDFIIVGGDENQINYWKGIGLSENLIFTGFVSQKDLGKYFDKFTVALLPNQDVVHSHGKNGSLTNISSYTSPLKLFEYMSRQKLILASDFPVIREVLDESFSYLLPFNEPKIWAETIKIALLNESQTLDKISIAKEVFLKNFSWNIRAEKILYKIANK